MRIILWLATVSAAAAALYGILDIVQAPSVFTGQRAGWSIEIWGGLRLLCVIASTVCIIALWRTRGKSVDVAPVNPNPIIQAESAKTYSLNQTSGPTPMQIERTHHVDASELDEAGMYEYYYEYDIYRFSNGAICFTARSYVDDPNEAHFLGVMVSDQSRMMVDSDLAQPLFLSALVYLEGHGKTNVRWLSGRGNGYESVPKSTSCEA